MLQSFIKCFNLYDTSLLVRSDHYYGHYGVYSECFSLSGNGSRHLVIHVIEEGSGIYAVAGSVSPVYYKPVKFHNGSSLEGSDLLNLDCQISLYAAMFCTRHILGPPRFLKYCSKVCFDSDNAKVT